MLLFPSTVETRYSNLKKRQKNMKARHAIPAQLALGLAIIFGFQATAFAEKASRLVHEPNMKMGAWELHKQLTGSGYPDKAWQDTSESSPQERVADSYFANKYTFQIIDAPALYESDLASIETNAIAAIVYLSDYVSWEGTLDFAVQFKPYDYFDVGGLGRLPALGGSAASGYTWAAEEAITGVDANGSGPEAGLYILPHEDGRITNYDTPISFDPSPDFYEAYAPPAGTNDFASIFLHEILHSLAFFQASPRFQELITVVDNSPEFIGAATHALLYQNLKLSPGDWNDHYARTPALENGGPEVDRGTMYEFGNYEQNRWHLGKVELAVLEDYGYEVANDQYLNLVEQPEAEAKSRPVKPSERSQKAFSNMINTLKSFLGG